MTNRKHFAFQQRVVSQRKHNEMKKIADGRGACLTEM